VGELTGIRKGKRGKADKTKVFTMGAVIGDKALLSEQVSQATVQNMGSGASAVVWSIGGGTYRNVLAANGERVAQRSRVRRHRRGVATCTVAIILRHPPPRTHRSLPSFFVRFVAHAPFLS
jgi:hypothetical protein